MSASKRRAFSPVGILALALAASCVGTAGDGSDSSVPPDSPHDAAAWRIGRYVDETGQIPARAWQTALEERERVVAATAARPEFGGVAPAAWVSRGPDNVAGRSRAMVIDPRNPQRMFAGSVSGGLWRSDDGGTNWAHVDDWWGNLSVPTLTLDPSNPDVMYVGTGEGFYSLGHLVRSFSHFVRGAGVMKSTDGGTTWSQLPSTAGWLHVTRIAVSPTNPNILLASRRPGGIARSTDGGATWTDVATGEHSFQVVFDPNDGNRAVAHFCATSALTHGVLTSSDAGATWQPAQSGLTSVAGERARIELCYAKSSPGVVYASVGDSGTVWRSADHGRNWTQRSSSGTSTGTSYYYNALWVDPTNENVLVIGALHVWRSTNGGQTFTQTTNGYIMTVDPHLDVHSVVADPGYDGVTNRRVYVTTDGGVHVANNIFAAAPGSGWVDLDATMTSTQFYAAAGHGSSDVVVGGTQDNGTLRVVGASRTANLNFGGDGGQVQIDPTDPRYVYGEYQYLGVHRSSNGGSSAGTITRGLGDFGSGNCNFIAPLRLDPNNSLRLYAGGRRLWRTANARASTVGWTAIKPDVGSLTSAIAIAPGLQDRVLVGHNDGRLYRTSNATASSPTWTAVDDNGATDPLPDRVVTRLVFDPSNASVVYATFAGFAADNLWRSADGGLTWQRITGTAPFALPTAPVYGMAVHPDDPDVLYAATEVGVFTSDDGGAHWTADNNGPANVVAEEISFMHGTRRLVLATLGRGLWTADVALPDVVAYGTGCGAPAAPTLAVDPLAPARIGKSLGLEATGLAPNQPLASLLIGLSDQSWNGTSLPLTLTAVGMPNCQLLCSVDGALSAPIAAGGTASWSLPLPDDRTLIGAWLYFQVASPAPGANATGIAMTQGLATQLGW